MSVSKSIYQGLFWKAAFYASVFLLNICISRYFEASVSGLIFYITNLYSFVILLLSFSIESGMTFFLSRNEMDASRLTAIAFIWTIVACGLAAIGLFIYSFPDSLSLVSNMPVISLFFLSGILLITFFSALLAARKDFRTAYVIQVAGNLSLAILLLLSYGKRHVVINAENLLYLYFASFLIEGIVIAFLFSYKQKFIFSFNGLIAQDFKKLFRFSFIIFISNLVYFLVYRIDYWFVEFYSDRNALGNYIQVSKIVQLLILAPSTISIVVFPYIAAGGKGAFITELQALSRVILAVFIILCTVLAITGFWLFPFLLGHTFGQMYVPFLLLIPGILSLASLYPYTAYYAGVNMAKRNVAGACIGLIVVVVSDLILIPRLGIKGAALASSIGYLCFQVYIMWKFKSDFGIKVRDSFILKQDDLRRISALKN